MNKKNIKSQIKQIENQIYILSERSYNPQLSPSEQKEIARRKKKLNKTKNKLSKRLDNVQ
jgi:signal transduction histidine kinase|tara:strand:+ start:53 stop:232 length:180 start_codon:yes stop_codon:yes gene_type:complete